LIKSYNKKNPNRPLRLVVSVMCPRHSAYFLAKKEFLGRFIVFKDVEVQPCDDPKALRKGLVLSEDIGVAVMNDYALSHIYISNDLKEE